MSVSHDTWDAHVIMAQPRKQLRTATATGQPLPHPFHPLGFFANCDTER